MRKMHILLVAGAFLMALGSQGFSQQPIRWEASLENAQRLATQTNRLVLIEFWTTWCVVCRRMDAEVYSQPSVAAEIATDYVPVKINAEYFPATANRFGVSAVPTVVILTPNGQVLEVIRGGLPASQYLARLTQVAANARPRRNPVYAQVPAERAPPANVSNGNLSAARVPAGNLFPAATPARPGQAGLTQPPATAAATVSMQTASRSISNSPSLPTAGLGGDRYSQYFSQNRLQTGSAGSAQPGGMAASGIAAPTGVPAGAAPASTAPFMPPPTSSSPSAATVAASPPSAPPITASLPRPQPPAMAARSPLPPPSDEKPSPAATGNAPLCLDGFCPVTLCERQQWVQGDRRYGAVHRGRTYLFTGPDEQRRFLSNPDQYAPVISGNDVVLAMDQRQAVPGMREHGVYYGNHVYLFASEASLEKFSKAPAAYANYAAGLLHASR